MFGAREGVMKRLADNVSSSVIIFKILIYILIMVLAQPRNV